jgi:hypothetical protein
MRSVHLAERRKQCYQERLARTVPMSLQPLEEEDVTTPPPAEAPAESEEDPYADVPCTD